MTCSSCAALTFASTRCHCGAVALLPDELELTATPLSYELPLERRGDREAGAPSFGPVTAEVDLERRFEPRGASLPPLSYELPAACGPAEIEIDLDDEIAAIAADGAPEPPASLARIALSHAVDLCVVLAVPAVPVALAANALELSPAELLTGFAAGGRALWAAAGLTALTAFVYLAASLTLGGRTLGDRVAGLRAVVLRSGAAPSPRQAALVAAAALVLSGPSLLHAVLDVHRRGLHDRLFGLVRLAAR